MSRSSPVKRSGIAERAMVLFCARECGTFDGEELSSLISWLSRNWTVWGAIYRKFLGKAGGRKTLEIGA
jgi:hypothetical protein